MDEIITVDEEKLAKYLTIWFNQAETHKDHFWNRNKVGRVIKDRLKNIGKWKNRRRGNPIKGYQAALVKNNS